MEPPLVNNAIRIVSTIDNFLDFIIVSSCTEMDQRELDFTLTWLLLALLKKSVFQQVMLVCIKFRFMCCPQMADCRWSLSIKRWDTVGDTCRAAGSLGDIPCHGDVFHIQHQCETLANLLGRLAQGATTRRQRLEQRMTQARLKGRGNTLSSKLTKARKAETHALKLAKDVKTLAGWNGTSWR
jgi:hypothetical protein